MELGLIITASPLVTRSLSLRLSSPHDVNSSRGGQYRGTPILGFSGSLGGSGIATASQQ